MRTGSVTFWAWMASISVHLIVLAIFFVVKSSQPSPRIAQASVPVAKVNQIRKLIQVAPTTPKPSIKRPVRQRLQKRGSKTISANQIFDAPGQISENSVNFEEPINSESAYSLTGSEIMAGRIEFFGSWTDHRKVCYVVDCSGSMQGIFSRVQKKLKESISALQPDQYFYIIFFGNDRLLEFGEGRLVRATEEIKSAACDFVDSAQPSGQTNTLAALERAAQIRDSMGGSTSVIYFLTDGFELTAEDARTFPRKISNLLNRFAPSTKVNTIGFWAQRQDREMLKIIAKQSGGEFVSVADNNY